MARSLSVDDGPQSALMLASMGRLQDALEVSRAVYERDRYNQVISNSYMLLHEAPLDRQGSDDLYAYLSRLYEAWPGGDFGRRMIIMGRVREGLAEHADLAPFITRDGKRRSAFVCRNCGRWRVIRRV